MNKTAQKSAENAKPPADKDAAAEKSPAADKSADAAPASQDDESATNGATDSPSGTETPAADSCAKDESASPLAKYDAETLRDMYLRAAADKENFAKRAETEIRKARDFALARFAPGICEVRDCLEKALAESESGGENDKAREGVLLTLRKLSAVMESNGVLPVRPDPGAAFDTNLHQAAGFAPGEENARTVCEIIQCGYTLHGRLIRPAIVRLGKPPAAAENDSAASSGADDS